eukprot:scaffold39525_cov55-Phaeocystis_antarctica.AAC.2
MLPVAVTVALVLALAAIVDEARAAMEPGVTLPRPGLDLVNPNPTPNPNVKPNPNLTRLEPRWNPQP